jgi:cell division protease FtsH
MRPVLWSYTAFLDAVHHGGVSSASILPDATVHYATDGVEHVTQLAPLQIPDVTRDLFAHHVDLAVVGPTAASALLRPLLDLFPLAMIGFFLLSVLNRGGVGAAAALGKGPAPVENVETRFSDVAGLTAAKEELREVVDFLRAPDRFAQTGARPPKGVLLEGPPGTGKTLLARAVAGEAGVAFLPVTASSFVEMYVGVGAARVRALFQKAKAQAPCIVWIDEIDAVAKQRSHAGGTAGNEERETTLNELLSAMDGFDKESGVVVLAATNRADMLDDALVRPGRFDRRVPVTLPDVTERADILAVHARDKTLDASVDLAVVARRTPGFSGAELANLMNEAAIRAVRRNDTVVSSEDVASALDRVVGGLPKPTPMDERTRLLVAVHEAGHALVGTLVDDYDTVDRVSIVPRSSGLGGFTAFVPDEARAVGGLYTREYLRAQLAVLLAGRAAEEIVLGATTTGAVSDLERVYMLARQMVVDFGFGSSLVANQDPQGKAADAVDEAIEALVEEAYSRALTVLNTHNKALATLAYALAEEETMDGDRVREILGV